MDLRQKKWVYEERLRMPILNPADIIIAKREISGRYRDSRGMQGWKKIAILGIVILLCILFAAQQAFNIPVFDIVSADSKELTSNYSSGQVTTAKLLLGLVAMGLMYGIYLIIEACNFSFQCLLVGPEQGTRDEFQGYQKAVKSAKIDITKDRLDQRMSEAQLGRLEEDMQAKMSQDLDIAVDESQYQAQARQGALSMQTGAGYAPARGAGYAPARGAGYNPQGIQGVRSSAANPFTNVPPGLGPQERRAMENLQRGVLFPSG